MISNDIDSIIECLEKQGYDLKLDKGELAKILKKYFDSETPKDKDEEVDEVRIDINDEESNSYENEENNDCENEINNNDSENKENNNLEIKFNEEMNAQLESYLNSYNETNLGDNNCVSEKNEYVEENNECVEENNEYTESNDVEDKNIKSLNNSLEELIKETEDKLNKELDNMLNKKDSKSSDYLYDLLKIKKSNKLDNKSDEKLNNRYSYSHKDLNDTRTNLYNKSDIYNKTSDYSYSNYNVNGEPRLGGIFSGRPSNLNNRFNNQYNYNRNYNNMNNFNDINYRREYEIPHRYGYNYNRYDPRVPNKSVYDIHNRIMDERIRAEQLREERMFQERMYEERMHEERMREERIREDRIREERLRDEQFREDRFRDDNYDKNKTIVKDYILIQDDGNKPPMVELLGQNLLNEIDGLKQDIMSYEVQDPKLSLRNIFDKFKDKKKVVVKYDKEEKQYYDGLEDKKKIKIDKLEDKISKLNNIIVPLRFRVLESNLPLHNKAMIINKIEDLFANKFMGGSEITKYSNWVNSALKIPFKKYKKLPLDVINSNSSDIGNYLVDVKKTLDTAVYGHTNTKEQIIQIIAQWITNPVSTGNCIGIEGVMGNGKTTLVKNGIAKAIDRPFAFITLGGCSDASFLEGHNYTYEGSMWGKIVDVLIQCKCMNPVFYFDELDKVSETPKGEEIINTLIHLTDASQNSQFSDKYFNGIPLDLSKSLFIFSYNDKSKINPILLDRLICIKTDDFKTEDKIEIAKNYLLKDIYSQLTIKDDLYKLSDENLKYIIDTYTEEGGVRTLKKHLFAIFSKLNLLKLTKHDENIKYTFDLDKSLLESNEIDQKKIDLLIGNKDKDKDEYYKTFYM